MDKLHEDKLRAEFEEKIREELLFDDEELVWKPERNCYATYGIHLAWWGYRVSRENLVVKIENHTEFEIEHMISPEKDGYSIGWIDGRNYAANQVRSIGLSIKGE